MSTVFCTCDNTKRAPSISLTPVAIFFYPNNLLYHVQHVEALMHKHAQTRHPILAQRADLTTTLQPILQMILLSGYLCI